MSGKRRYREAVGHRIEVLEACARFFFLRCFLTGISRICEPHDDQRDNEDAGDRADELSKAAELLTVWLEQDRDSEDSAPESIAILVRDRYQRDAVVNGLAQHGIEVRAVDREAAGRGRPVVMTMHRAKGLEFRKVLLFDVSKNAIPRPLRDQQYSDADSDDALLRERSLLYVAATRARDQLAISWSGEASPLITALAP